MVTVPLEMLACGDDLERDKGLELPPGGRAINRSQGQGLPNDAGRLMDLLLQDSALCSHVKASAESVQEIASVVPALGLNLVYQLGDTLSTVRFRA